MLFPLRAGVAAVICSTFALGLVIHRAASAEDGIVRFVSDNTVVAEPSDFVGAEDYEAYAEDDVQPWSFWSASWLNLQPPVAPAAPETTEFGLVDPASGASLTQSVFASQDVRRSLITQTRQSPPFGSGNELVFGSEGRFRVTTDGGNLLGKSMFAPSVKVQQRTPVITDPRVRGARAGRLLASGSYWAPARQDLDTLMSKIDSRIIGDVVVVKGPYSVRYGPGTNFIDFQLLETPRYACGYEWHGSTSMEYKTNGEQLYGRDMVWGGGEDYGYRVSYGHRTGNDYRDGSGFRLPTSYNSRDLDVALGYDLNDYSSVEFNYLRLDQTGVEFPGLVFDINALVTDGFEVRYTNEAPPIFDLVTVDGWYNRTRFNGDTSRAGKTRQIPTVNFNHDLVPAPGVVPTMPGQFLLTNVDGMSAGYRIAGTWGDPAGEQTTIGTDLIRLGTQLNDISPAHTLVIPPPLPFLPPIIIPVPTRNFPIPRSRSLDVGLFADHTRPVNDQLTINMGARVDLVAADAENTAPALVRVIGGSFMPTTISAIKQADLNQHFTPWAVYVAADYEVNCCWRLTAAAGHSVRPPDLTELYATGPFIGTLQPGQTFIQGDPEIKPERHTQIDVGAHANLGATRMSVSAFYAWVNDYIVYDVFEDRVPAGSFMPGTDLLGVALGNTDLATLMGVELFAEHDVRDWLTAFAVVSYLQGRDHTRSTPTRMGEVFRSQVPVPFPGMGTFAGAPRSYAAHDDEPLPGIPPLEARVGLQFHEPVPDPWWGWEIEARMVDSQNRVASSLFERKTSGFTVWNLRGFVRPRENLTLIGGVENFTDNQYREHLDYRPGFGVRRPGINFYTSAEMTY